MSVWVGVHTTVATPNRQPGNGLVIAMGLVVGSLCHMLAQASTSSAGTSLGDHDLLVSQRLGFILAPAVGLWLGWLQRSWRRAMIGSGLGLLIGWLYFLFCSAGEVRPITIVVLSVLGGVFAASCGSNRTDWLRGLAGRFAKGLLAGLLLGLVYTALISLGPLAFWPRSGNVDHLGAHLRMMRRAGPFALGLSGALLFPSIRWAVGLTRPRALLQPIQPCEVAHAAAPRR